MNLIKTNVIQALPEKPYIMLRSQPESREEGEREGERERERLTNENV